MNNLSAEKSLIGKKFPEIPIIASRICGELSVSHSLTAIKAIESACGITPSVQTEKLRRLMLIAHIIKSHTDHLYQSIIPEFLGLESFCDLKKDHLEIFKNAIALQKYTDRIFHLVGGRAVHQISTVSGGFKSYPSTLEIESLDNDSKNIADSANELLSLVFSFKLPNIARKITFLALHKRDIYALDTGEVWSDTGEHFMANEAEQFLIDKSIADQKIRKIFLKNKVISAGSLARLKLNKLSAEIKKTIDDAQMSFENPYSNIYAEAIEINILIQESLELLRHFAKNDIEDEPIKLPKKFGTGSAVCESPTGLLFYSLDFDKEGRLLKYEIITPTELNLLAFKNDYKIVQKTIEKLDKREQARLIKLLALSYNISLPRDD